MSLWSFPVRSASCLKRSVASALALAVSVGLSACGGGSTSNPLGNPATVSNPTNAGGQKLSFVYFQKCINPILLAQLPALQGGGSTNSCAGAGCHDAVSGSGGALRVAPGAQVVDLADPGNSPEVIRTTDMYKNFYSSQGAVVIGSSGQSRLLAKPLLLVLHGGGQIFANVSDTNAALIAYWINHPVPKGQDEFSAVASTMFTPPDPQTGTCNTQ
jgi:hypothetical protein